MSRNILVTGGAGFVGSYVVKKLIDMGEKVIIFDNLSERKGGLLFIHPKATFIEGDVTNPFDYDKLDAFQIDVIYHLAAQTSGESSFKDPKQDILINSYGTLLMARFCKEKGIKRFIYTSTSAIYGSACKNIVDENTPIEPDSTYGVSKYSGEFFIKQIFKDTDTKYSIFRLTNNYGPGENLNYMKKGMVSIFCGFVWKGEPIHVKGSLDRFRDFLYVGDTADALVLALDMEQSYNQIYLLSSGKKIYVKELVEGILKAAGKENYPVEVSGETPGDTEGFHADISKIKRELGWEPKTNLEEGLRIYFDWIKKVPLQEDITKFHPFNLN